MRKAKEIMKIFFYDQGSVSEHFDGFFESIGLRFAQKPGPYPQLIADHKVVGWFPHPGKFEIETIYLDQYPGMEEFIQSHFIQQND